MVRVLNTQSRYDCVWTMRVNAAGAAGRYCSGRIPRLALGVVLWALTVSLHAARPAPAPYAAVEVDRFVPERGITFPADYQGALVDDIARDISVEFPTVIIVRQGDPRPYGPAVLRISGTVIEFNPGNTAKRGLFGFGAGAPVVRAQVRLSDAVRGEVLLDREIKGTVWTGTAGTGSQGAGDSLAKKIVKVCNAAHLIESH
jgi:hypothetical protein